ncbi:MAG: DUF4870 domain-containing protein [Planctomycetota bacterium]|nr:MAG: DUF4870 domain-containing protein [Planctomycetota bacterium]
MFSWHSPPQASDAPQPSSAEQPSTEARSWSALMHVAGLASYLAPVPGAGIVAPLVLWLVRRDESAFEQRQGLLAINFQLICAALYLGSLLLVPLLIGVPLVLLVVVLHVVATLAATIMAASGRSARYPLNPQVFTANTLR